MLITPVQVITVWACSCDLLVFIYALLSAGYAMLLGATSDKLNAYLFHSLFTVYNLLNRLLFVCFYRLLLWCWYIMGISTPLVAAQSFCQINTLLLLLGNVLFISAPCIDKSWSTCNDVSMFQSRHQSRRRIGASQVSQSSHFISFHFVSV